MLDPISAIREERRRQDEKWGLQNHTYPTWKVILGEELGEADNEWLKGHFGKRNTGKELREEMVQCAAVLVAMLECGDRNGWFDERTTVETPAF